MLLPSDQLPLHADSKDSRLLESSPLPFAGASDMKPPSYTQALPFAISSSEPQPTPNDPPPPEPGTYVFKATSATVTCLQSKSGGGQVIYHILTERLAISQVTLITIRRGAPGQGGRATATFELDGRDTIIIRGRRYTRSKMFAVIPGVISKYSRQLFCEYGDFHSRWTRDLTYPKRRVILCHKKMGINNSSIRTFARLYLADKMRSVWDPETYLEDPELEIFPDGLERLDDHLVCVVVLLLEKPEMIAKLFSL